MNPADALPQDRRMYYHRCWMRHATHGIGMVTVDGDGETMYFYTFPSNKTDAAPEVVKPKDLVCWWPRAGAYNTESGSAIYVSRRAIRNMRKSAMGMDHYHVKWGKPIDGVQLMLIMRKGPDRYALNYALQVLRDGLVKSVAITRDIILARNKFDSIMVIFRGLEAGEYRNGEFIPSFNGSPLAKRVMYKLAREELRCE